MIHRQMMNCRHTIESNERITKWLNSVFLDGSEFQLGTRVKTIQRNFVRFSEFCEEFRPMHLIHTQMKLDYSQKIHAVLRVFWYLPSFTIVQLLIFQNLLNLLFQNEKNLEKWNFGWNSSVSTSFPIYTSDSRLWIQTLFVSILLQPRFAKIIFCR